MMYTLYKLGDLFSCPHCGLVQEYQVQDYLIQLNGEKSYSNEECAYCYGDMHFVSLNEGIFRVSATRSGLLIKEKKDEVNYHV